MAEPDLNPSWVPEPKEHSRLLSIGGFDSTGGKKHVFNLHGGGKRHVPDTKPTPLPNFTPPFQCIVGQTLAASRKLFSLSASLPSWGTSRSSLFTV